MPIMRNVHLISVQSWTYLMTQEERKAFLKKVSKICPDPEAYKKCFNFKITPSSSTSARSSARQPACDLSDLSALCKHFSKEEQVSLLEKAKTVLDNDQFHQGFKDSVYFVDSGGSLPHRVQCFKSGKCTCDCNFFVRNNLCHHCLAIAIHLNCVANTAEVLARYQQPLLHIMLVVRLHPESDLYQQLKNQFTILQVQMWTQTIQKQISKLKL